MDRLSAVKVLDGATLERANFRLEENTGLGLLRLQTFHRKPGEVEDLSARLGIQLPGSGETLAQQDKQWFWSAPGEWVVAVAAGTEQEVSRSLQAKLDGQFVVLSVMTDSRVVFDHSGECARDVSARGSTVDFHSTSFGANRCINTRFAGVPVMLACPYGGDKFLLFADRSLAQYLLRWFTSASVGDR